MAGDKKIVCRKSKLENPSGDYSFVSEYFFFHTNTNKEDDGELYGKLQKCDDNVFRYFHIQNNHSFGYTEKDLILIAKKLKKLNK